MRLIERKNIFIASASVFLIALYLFFRFFLGFSKSSSNPILFPLLIIGGISLLFDLASGLLRRELGTDLLAGISVAASLLLGEYLAGAIIVVMFFGGGALEDYAVGQASSVLKALAKRLPSAAHLHRGVELAEVPIGDVEIGDLIEVFPHEACPVDGTVTEGHGSMDEAYLTGEPFQVDKAPGASVISGAINGESPLTIRAAKKAIDSRYSKIMEVMRDSEKNKPRLRRMAERLGAFYTPAALLVGTLAWVLSGDPKRFLAVLVIATPCPLLIAIPVAILGAISLAAKRSIIIKNPIALERIDECRTAIFDKTGTLTYGEPEFSEMICKPGLTDNEVLGFAASLERYSKHPLAAAILEEARKRKLVFHEASEVLVVPGRGLRGTVAGRIVEITSRNLLREDEQKFLPPLSEGLECVLLMDGNYAATLRFRDTPRVEGRSFIRHLGPRHGLDRTMIVSGDRESEVRYLAEKVGISEVYAEKSPEDKLRIVKEETRKAKTLYVGDGINDAPALMAATVGIAIGKNSDVTSQAAGVVVMDNSLSKVDEFMHISRRLRKIALQSAVGGIILSCLGMAAAAAGYLTPVAGAILQEGIDVLSILNALRAAFPPKELSDFKEVRP